MIELHLRLRVQPGRGAELVALLREAIPFYESPGGIRVRLLQDRADPERFIELVEYDSAAAYEADQRRVKTDSAMSAYLSRWRDLLAEPPAVEVYQRREIPAAQ